MKWKEDFESKGVVCSLRVMDSSMLSVQCDTCIFGRAAVVKQVTIMCKRNFACWKCEGNVGEAVEQEETLCDDVETVRGFTYLGDRVSVGGGCEAAVTARTRSGWIKFWECGMLLYGQFGNNGKFEKGYL